MSLWPPQREPVVPAVKAVSSPSADVEHLDAWVDRGEVAQEEIQVEVEVREQIELVDQDQLDGSKHHRVLQGLLFAFGDRVDHDAVMGTNVELGRTDKVANVLDEEQVHGGQVERGENRGHHRSVQ